MAEERIKIPRCPDRTLAEFLTELGDRFGVPSANIVALGNSPIGQVSTTAEPPEYWQALLAHDSCLVETVHWNAYGLNFNFARGGQIGLDHKSPIYDEIVITGEQSPEHVPNRLAIVAFIFERLHGFHPKRTVEGSLSKDQSDLLAIHQSTLERLESLNEKLIIDGSEFRKRLDDDYSVRLAKLDNRAIEDRANLAEEAKRRSEEIEKREEALAVELKKFEDRNNTLVRRDLRDSMLRDAKERISKFGVSNATKYKRIPVGVAMALLCIFFSGVMLYTFNRIEQFSEDRKTEFQGVSRMLNDADRELELKLAAQFMPTLTDLYWLWARLAISSIGLVSTIIFFMRWKNAWATQHATSEFPLLQFQQDISRANWIMESCLEWRKETKSAIPTELLTSITRSLFAEGSAETDVVVHPADELASALLGSASKLKLRVGENELEFDKPGKIAKQTIRKD